MSARRSNEMTKANIIRSVVLFSTLGLNSLGQRWHEIVPLHSTCDDVKRVLKIEKCETGSYEFEDERIFIWFASDPCNDGWNVPRGTVTSIEVFPRKNLRLTDVGFQEGAFEDRSKDSSGTIRYRNETSGVIASVRSDGTVQSIAYVPRKSDSNLRYSKGASQQTSGVDPHAVLKFDEYVIVSGQIRSDRLESLARRLQNEPSSHAYIITYGGRHSGPGDAQVYGSRARKFLISRGAKPTRVHAVDGGYRETPSIELFLSAKEGAAPIPTPTLCSSEIESRKTRRTH